MQQDSEIYVGLDTSKLKISVALATRLIPLTQVPTISSGRARTRLHASHHIWG